MTTNDRSGETWSSDEAVQPSNVSEQGARAAYLPDVATLAQMANEFFKALPLQGASPVQTPVAQPRDVPSFETRLPQFGAPAPGLPAIPSANALPNEADLQKAISGAAPSGLPEEFSLASLAVLPVIEIPKVLDASSRFAFSPEQAQSPFSIPLPPFELKFPSFEAGLPSISSLAELPTAEVAHTAQPSFYFLENAVL